MEKDKQNNDLRVAPNKGTGECGRTRSHKNVIQWVQCASSLVGCPIFHDQRIVEVKL
jgi:hypothetical protein